MWLLKQRVVWYRTWWTDGEERCQFREEERDCEWCICKLSEERSMSDNMITSACWWDKIVLHSTTYKMTMFGVHVIEDKKFVRMHLFPSELCEFSSNKWFDTAFDGHIAKNVVSLMKNKMIVDDAYVTCRRNAKWRTIWSSQRVNKIKLY